MATRRLILLAAALLIGTTFAATGCVPAIGDECASNGDCPQEAICDSTAPGGYCTIPDCTRGGCPGNAICVEFEDESQTFCMKPCEDDNDCRDAYTCRNESYSRPFCYVEP